MRRLSALALPLVISLCLVSFAFADDLLTGTWNATANSPQGTVGFTLTLSLADGKVSGTVGSDGMSDAISDAAFDGETLTFTAPYNGMAVAMRAKLADGKLVGTFTVNGGEATGDWEATKAK